MATAFYRTRDGDMLARIRNDGRAVPELFDLRTRTWHRYAALDTLHDARQITEAEALQMGATRGDLSAAGGARVPLRAA